jgi:hypothetical protein
VGPKVRGGVRSGVRGGRGGASHFSEFQNLNFPERLAGERGNWEWLGGEVGRGAGGWGGGVLRGGRESRASGRVTRELTRQAHIF